MEKAPSIPEPFVGWRGWIVSGPIKENDNPTLHSITQSHVRWPSREPLKSYCGTSKLTLAMSDTLIAKSKTRCTFEEIPTERCWCGIHALHNLDLLMVSGWNYVTQDEMEPPPYMNRYFSLKNYPVIGEVSMWGNMLVGDLGIRSQWGYPKNLFVRDEHEFLCDILNDIYGVPVYTAKDLKDSESEYWRAS
jgi:hypothetical protein